MWLLRKAIAGALLIVAGPGVAQVYPTQPLKMIIPYPAGGPTDIPGRLISKSSPNPGDKISLLTTGTGGAGMIGCSPGGRGMQSLA